MIDKVWAIKSREEKVATNGNRYLQVMVAGDDGKDHKYNLYEQGMWAVFQKNDYVSVKLEKPEGKSGWEVRAASSVADILPPAKEPEPLPAEAQATVNKAVESVPPKPTPEPAPQAVGMITKEIGDMIRAKYLVSIFGAETQKELVKWYRSQVLGITRIQYDGAKLPTFEKGD